jgi:PTS system fructose-specific IIA component
VSILIFSKEQFFLDIEINHKSEVLKYIAIQAENLNITSNSTKLYEDLQSREKEYPTAVQHLIGIPHTKSTVVKEAKLIFIRLRNPIEWGSPDGFRVKAVFAILVPEAKASQEHLKILSNVAVHLLDEDFQKKILTIEEEAVLLPYLENIIKEEK